MATLSVWTPHDGLLACVAPLGLAAAAGTALMVDLDPDGPAYPGERSLAELVARGPRRVDLSPARSGLAVVRNGGIEPDTNEEVTVILEALSAGWPNLVLRLPSGKLRLPTPGLVPVIPILPGSLTVVWDGPAVRQPTGLAVPRDSLGVTLPRLPRSTLVALLRGRLPRGRWIRAWRPVWELPW